MASIHLEPPESFNFSKPNDWPKWKRRFQQYRTASGLTKEDDPRQVSTLMYCLGETADDVLTSTNIFAEDQEKYDAVMAKFDEFFKVRRNVIFECAKFNHRSQMAGESAEQYISTLYHLVETCEYGTLKEEMLRDRIVVGMRDAALSERLQMDASLTLDKVKRELRQKEAVKEQHLQLQHESTPTALDSVKTRWPQKRGAMGAGAKTVKPLCTRCGKGRHPPGVRCPASSAVCHRCNRKGHYESQCFSKMVAPTEELTVTDELTEGAFLGTVSNEQNCSWMVSVQVGDKTVPFKA